MSERTPIPREVRSVIEIASYHSCTLQKESDSESAWWYFSRLAPKEQHHVIDAMQEFDHILLRRTHDGTNAFAIGVKADEWYDMSGEPITRDDVELLRSMAEWRVRPWTLRSQTNRYLNAMIIGLAVALVCFAVYGTDTRDEMIEVLSIDATFCVFMAGIMLLARVKWQTGRRKLLDLMPKIEALAPAPT